MFLLDFSTTIRVSYPNAHLMVGLPTVHCLEHWRHLNVYIRVTALTDRHTHTHRQTQPL